MALDRIVAPLAYGPEPDAGNFWRTTRASPTLPGVAGTVRAEFAVIGAGYTGLSAALRLAEAGADVAVVDAHAPGWGASGRNGGFCCLGGSPLSDATLIRRYGAEAAQDYFLAERAAVDGVAERLETHAIEAERHSEGETYLAHSKAHIADLQAHATAMSARYGRTLHVDPREALAQMGLSSPEFHGAVTVPIGFALNPLSYALGLAEAATRAGARLFAQSPVHRIVANGAGYGLETPRGTLFARQLLIATNGYSSEDVPPWLKGRYLPVQSNILVSRPISDSALADQGWTSDQMCYDTRRYLHYVRLMPARPGETGRRMLFGVRGRGRVSRRALAATRAAARADFERIFPAWAPVETPHFWQGLLCLTRSLTPFVGRVPGMGGAYAALGYHGNGVAMGSHAGALMAELALGRPVAIPAPMAGPLRRFPLGRWRGWLLTGVGAAHRAQDWAEARLGSR